MIILLSGDGKYLLEETELDAVQVVGKLLFSLLGRGDDQEYERKLGELHEFIKKNGTPVEVYKNADLIVPPLLCDPVTMRSMLGLQKNP